MMELVSAQCRMNFGHDSGGREEACRTFRKITRKPGKERNTAAPITTVRKKLKFVTVKVHGTEIDVLLDSGAISNLLSKELTDDMGKSIKGTWKEISVSDGSTKTCDG